MKRRTPIKIKSGRIVISEKALQEQLRQAAKILGWKYYHPWISIKSTEGFPDTALIKGGHLWFVECKTETGKVTPAQQAWLDALSEVGSPAVMATVLRPSGFDAFWKEMWAIRR